MIFPRETLRAALFLCLAPLLASCSTAPPPGVTPVDGFAIDRYLGTWYEVARLDHRFERGLVAVTARYARREDGGVDVVNRGWDTREGAWDEADGKAYFTGDPHTAALKVSFFGPFYGGYVVLALDRDAPDYGYALVSGPSRDYLWVLSRTPSLPEDRYRALVTMAGDLGYPVERLLRVDQSRNMGTEAASNPTASPIP